MTGTITRFGIVSFYRKGVKEWTGILKVIERSLLETRVTLRGPDAACLLDDVAIDYEQYIDKTSDWIINDLLTKYKCGITAGILTPSTDTITLDIVYVTLRAAIQTICDTVGWVYRVNFDFTLDFAPTFSHGLVAVAFTEGVDILDCKTLEDYTILKNEVRVRGARPTPEEEPITTVATVPTSTPNVSGGIDEFGVHAVSEFREDIGHQTTLDRMGRSSVDRRAKGQVPK